MTPTELLVLAGAFLAACGLLTAWVAGRFGRNRFGWWVAGTALGPLAIPPLVGLIRGARRTPPESRTVGTPIQRAGPGVLVAADTAGGLQTAATTARELLSWMEPAVTLALFADAEAAPTGRRGGVWLGGEAEAPLRRVLSRVEAEQPGSALEGKILFGEPVAAVLAEVRRAGHSFVIVQLTSGRGDRAALAALAVRARCPVLVPGAPAPDRRPAPARAGRPAGDAR